MKNKDIDHSLSAEDVLATEINELGQNSAPGDEKSYRYLLAHQTVKSWSQWATIAGFIPFPYLDATTIAALQGKMAYELCKIYGVPFKKESVAAIIGSLAGGGITTVVGGQVGRELVKGIPLVGQVLSMATQPAAAYAYTYAMGIVFIKHFETNGNLVNLEVEHFKNLFQEQASKAKSFFTKNIDVLSKKKSAVISKIRGKKQAEVQTD